MNLELLTTSRAACFRRCRREHKYAYEDCVRPLRVPMPLGFGRMFHDGVESWRLSLKEKRAKEECLSLALAAVKACWLSVESESDELDMFELIRAEEMIIGYHFRWYDHDSTLLEYLEVEAQFEAPLRNPKTNASSRTFRRGGKVDAIAKFLKEFRDEVWLMETKTTSADISPGSDYWKRLRIDSQVSNYYVGAESLGHALHGCCYDVAKKPSMQPAKATPEESRKYTKPKACKTCVAAVKERAKLAKVKVLAKDVPLTDGCQDCEPPRLYANLRDVDETPAEFRVRVQEALQEAPDMYFARGEVVRLESELYEAACDSWLIAGEIRGAKNMDAWPRNPDACVRYGRFCTYFNVCTGAADIDDPTIFRRGKRHPELSDQAATTEASNAG